MTAANQKEDAALLDAMATLALEAGAVIMEIYATGCETERKADDSPVTIADRRGEAVICKGLGAIAPSIPILAEERACDGDIPPLDHEFFLVDPLDGTREFIDRTGEFTVNIALIRGGRPALGVVYAPAAGKIYGGGPGLGAWRAPVDEDGRMGAKAPIMAAPAPAGGLVAVASRSHRSPETDEFLKTLNVADFAAAGSSLKFCLIAEGAAHIYPRFGRTMEWDTGAGQAVLEGAGGEVRVHPEGGPLAYKKAARGFDNPWFIAAAPGVEA